MPDHCVLPSALTAITRTVTVAAGRFAPGHLGELTAVVPFELVDAVLADTRAVQRRLRDLPSRVGVYFLLAMCLFPEAGYRLVWDKLTAGLSGMPVVCPSAKALRDLRRRIGSVPVRALFEVLAGLLARPTTPGVRFGSYRMVSFDGCSSLGVPDSERNRAWLGRTSHHGYPTLELMTLVETGTRALVGAVFGPTAEGETSYAGRLLHLLRPDMLVLWDKGFDSNAFLAQVTRTFATMTNALLELRDWLVAEQVTLVVMEATGDYWRPVFYLLEDCLNVILVNAAHAKGLPGRKTDVADSQWLCQLGECSLLKASFVPPEPIRHLRDLTRYRTSLTMERSREAQRLEKELEDARIKLSSVATEILGVSGRAMLTALIDGERDVHTLAQMAKARMRPKIPVLVEALTGNFGEHHAFLCRLHLERIDHLTETIAELSARIEEEMLPFAHQLELLETIPGVGRATAEAVIAETGGDMGRFRTAGHLASWAGVCPGHHESAGKHKSGR